MPDLNEPGTRVTSFPKGFAARVGEAVRYAITGVTPATWFGPMQPLAPMAPEGTGGRRFDYPVGYNLQYQPRTDEPFSFATLRGLADTCDMLRLVIETRKDQIEAQSWDVRPRKRADGTHPKASAFAVEIAAAKNFFAAPDREHDLAGWLRMIAEEMFVTDAVSLHVRPDRAGRIFAFEAIDGATIAPRIDAWGRTPAPPDVAYQQVLHGVPAADFSTDQLIYFPRNRRPGHVYGYSPVEQVITTANILVRRSAHQLAYNTYGNELQDASDVVEYAYTVTGRGYGGGSGGVPTQPTGLTATGIPGAIALSWNANPQTDNVASYQVLRATASGGPFAQIWSGNATSYTDANATIGTPYYYEITATNAAGTSVPSASASATAMPLQSGSSRSITVSTSSVTLTSTDNYVGITNTSGGAITVNLPSSPGTYQDIRLADEGSNAATYTWTIKNGAGATVGTVVTNAGGISLHWTGSVWQQVF